MSEIEKYYFIDKPKIERFIRDQLLKGHELSETLLLKARLSKGEKYTLAPECVEKTMVYSFHRGGMFSRSIRNAVTMSNRHELIENTIHNHLKNSHHSIAIIEDALAKPSDPFLKKVNTRYFTIGDHVFHYMTMQDDVSSISRFVKQISYMPPSICFLCYGRNFLSNSIKKVNLSENLEYSSVIISAYDGESYVIWGLDS